MFCKVLYVLVVYGVDVFLQWLYLYYHMFSLLFNVGNFILMYACAIFDCSQMLLAFSFVGSDVFLDSRIKNLLTSLFTLYTTTATLEEFDFRCQIPGTSSFYDL